jgi:hypothetical protein
MHGDERPGTNNRGSRSEPRTGTTVGNEHLRGTFEFMSIAELPLKAPQLVAAARWSSRGVVIPPKTKASLDCLSDPRSQPLGNIA